MLSPVLFESIFKSKLLLELCHHQRVVIISDDTVRALYAEPLTAYLADHHIDAQVLSFAAGEQSKTRATKAALEDQLIELACTRDTCLLALGGGVVTDLAGFVAATYCRGVPVIYLPTTLLAMVDAAIGGKTGVNTACGKNLIGTFTQPKAIIVDVDLLASLPAKEYQFAFAEIIKHALIQDVEYFNFLLEHVEQLKRRDTVVLKQVIQRSIDIKSTIVTMDQTEQGCRELLNAGHTIAHGLECLSDYTLPHGQAVAIGLLVEAVMAMRLGLLPETDFVRIHDLLKAFELPLTIQFAISTDKFKQALFITYP